MIADIRYKLKELEGQTFFTVTGKSYTYYFIGENMLRTSRANRNISLADFEKAIAIAPEKPSQLPMSINGRSYVFGIITDSRFKSGRREK